MKDLRGERAGAGTRLKLVVNNWIVGLVGVLAETVTFARGIGVEPERFLETIEGGPLGLPYAHIKGNMMSSATRTRCLSGGVTKRRADLPHSGLPIYLIYWS
jgi:3-hydroxyisobutyrate dehydrogenase